MAPYACTWTSCSEANPGPGPPSAARRGPGGRPPPPERHQRHDQPGRGEQGDGPHHLAPAVAAPLPGHRPFAFAGLAGTLPARRVVHLRRLPPGLLVPPGPAPGLRRQRHVRDAVAAAPPVAPAAGHRRPFRESRAGPGASWRQCNQRLVRSRACGLQGNPGLTRASTSPGRRAWKRWRRPRWLRRRRTRRRRPGRRR